MRQLCPKGNDAQVDLLQETALAMIEEAHRQRFDTESSLRYWFALQVKPRAEKAVAAIAANKGLEGFLPLQKVRRNWSDRVKVLELPLFPGYLFCRMCVENRLPALTIPGVLGMVGVGKTPLAIADGEIASIQAAVASGLWTEPCAFLEAGQEIRIAEGPLAGLEGIYLESKKQHRIVVSIALLKRSIAIEIERDWVRPLKPPTYNPLLQLAASVR